MENFYYELISEQNDYLASIDSNIETIMQNDVTFQNNVINSLGVLSCGVYIILIILVILSVFK